MERLGILISIRTEEEKKRELRNMAFVRKFIQIQTSILNRVETGTRTCSLRSLIEPYFQHAPMMT